MSEALLGYVGLGTMGAPMARHLVDWPGGLIVYDVRGTAMSPFAASGVTIAADLAEVAAADLISVAVLNDAQVQAVVTEIARHTAAGTVIAIHSTVADTTVVELATRWEPHGLYVIDAPVSGGAGAAEAGDLATMVGARRPVCERVKPVFKRWASLVIHAGDPGAGTRMKLARNMVTFTAFAAACEALNLAERAGLDLQALGRVVRHTDAITGGPGAIMVRDDMAVLDPGHWLYETFSHTRELGEKDLGLALELGRSLDVDLPLARVALQRLAAGLGVPDTPTNK